MSCGYVTKHGSRGRGEHRPRGEQFATGGQRLARQAARVLEVRRLHATRVRGREDDKLDLVRVACGSAAKRASTSKVSAWIAASIAPAGGPPVRRGPVCVGRTYTRSAPSATACEIGVLLTTPPSIRSWSPMTTGGKTPGIEAEAVIASTAGPSESRTSRPPIMS